MFSRVWESFTSRFSSSTTQTTAGTSSSQATGNNYGAKSGGNEGGYSSGSDDEKEGNLREESYTIRVTSSVNTNNTGR